VFTQPQFRCFDEELTHVERNKKCLFIQFIHITTFKSWSVFFWQHIELTISRARVELARERQPITPRMAQETAMNGMQDKDTHGQAPTSMQTYLG